MLIILSVKYCQAFLINENRTTYQTVLSGKCGNLIGQFAQNAPLAEPKQLLYGEWKSGIRCIALPGNTNTFYYCCSKQNEMLTL